jgi:hypothetical protein
MGRALRHAAMTRRAGGAGLVRDLGLIGLLGLGACSIRPKASESRGPRAASRCVPLFVPVAAPHLSRAESGDARVRWGRALAWALGNAAGLACPHARARRSFASASAAPTVDSLHRQARRMLADIAPDSPRRSWLDALEAAQADWQRPITLEADGFVIPRLGAIARLEDFVSEAECAGTFAWAVRPSTSRVSISCGSRLLGRREDEHEAPISSPKERRPGAKLRAVVVGPPGKRTP